MLPRPSSVKHGIAKHGRAMNEFIVNTVSASLRAVAEEKSRAVDLLRDTRERAPTPGTVLIAALRKRRARFVTLWLAALFAILIVSAAAGPKYTATATLEPDLRAQESVKGVAAPVLDPGAVVEAAVRRIHSHPTARAVVDKLQLAAPREPSLRDTVATTLARLMGTRRPSEADAAARELLSGLDVKGDRKAYLITLSYTSSSATKAAEAVNAVASEYVHNIEMQRLMARVTLSRNTLLDLEAAYGEDYPAVQRARSDLAAMRLAADRYRNGAKLLSAAELAESGMVVPAQATTIPSGLSLTNFLILSTTAAFLLAALLVLFAERLAVYKFVRRSKMFSPLEGE